MFERLKSAIGHARTPDPWAYATRAAEQDSTDFFNMMTARHRYGPASLSLSGDGREFYQLRTYQAGDPLTRMDWKSSARRDHLMIRENDHDFDRHVYFCVLEDAYLDYKADALSPSRRQEIEKFALSIALAAIHHGFQIGVLGDGLYGRTENAAQVMLENLSGLKADDMRAQNLVVFISGLTDPMPFLQNHVPKFACVIQCLDPTEIDLPFEGQCLVSATENEKNYRVDDFEAVRNAYQNRLLAHITQLRDQIENYNYHFICVRTDTQADNLFKAIQNPVVTLP